MKVVVVGAGPGGSAAAIAAARGGAEVTVIERARFPRDKACGDGITSDGVEVLERLGATRIVAEGHHIHGARFRHGDDAHVAFEATGKAAMTMPRFRFDQMLVDLAVEQSVAFISGERVEQVRSSAGRAVGVATGSGRSVEADAVIIADGATSPLRGRLIGPHPADATGLAVRGYATGVSTSCFH